MNEIEDAAIIMIGSRIALSGIIWYKNAKYVC